MESEYEHLLKYSFDVFLLYLVYLLCAASYYDFTRFQTQMSKCIWY